LTRCGKVSERTKGTASAVPHRAGPMRASARDTGVPTYFGAANWPAEDILSCWINAPLELCQPRTLVRGSGFSNPRERSGISIQGFKPWWRPIPRTYPTVELSRRHFSPWGLASLPCADFFRSLFSP
jgi:hypothetical protein